MRRYLILPAFLLLLAGCTSSRTERVRPPAAESQAPALVVERFLQAANTNDLRTMTSLFGTSEHTIDELEPPDMAQERMYLLASILRHDDFRIVGQGVVPGRISEATELLVRLRKGEEETEPVPFLVVRREGGGWIIEKIDVQIITGGS